jgi:dUTPase
MSELKNTMYIHIPTHHQYYLEPKYVEQIKHHNMAMYSDDHPDSGFDLYIPYNTSTSDGTWGIPSKSVIHIPLGIHIVLRKELVNRTKPYYIYSRNSITQTPLRLAAGTGIINSGYRGELVLALDNISDRYYRLNPGVRLVQACMPDLEPFHMKYSIHNFNHTTRNVGGFDSSGK